MAKSNIRSIRMDDRIMEIIEAQAGENFTLKFEALVTRCMWELPQKEEELNRIHKEIEKAKKQLEEMKLLYAKVSRNAFFISNSLEAISNDLSKHKSKNSES